MKKKAVLFFLFAGILAAPFSAGAFSLGGFNFYVTNELIYQYNQLAEENNQFYELLTVAANIKSWSLGVTLRAFNFYHQVPNTTLDAMGVDLYRFYFRYNSKRFKINLGDFYSLLGRGLVLSILKNEEILRERTITGGDLLYHRGKFDLRLLGGVVTDETEKQKWKLAAAEGHVEWVKNHRVGVLFSYVDDVDTQMKLGKRLTYSLSGQGDKIFDYFSYYVEAGWLDFYENDFFQEDGSAIYANITFNRSHITSFVEYKNYKHFNNEMNNPPVADRQDEVSPVADTEGARLYFQYAFFDPDLRLYMNWGRYREYDDTGNHIYGGMAAEDVWERVDISMNYGIKDILYPIKKFDLDIIYRMSERLSVQASVKNKYYRDGDFIFREQDHVFQVSLAPMFSFLFMHQYSYNKIADLNHFWSGGIKVTLKGRTVIELSVGTIRGGQVCSGGQCFILPPFKGVKLSIFHIFN